MVFLFVVKKNKLLNQFKALKTLLKMSQEGLSVDITRMRAPYRKKMDVFTEDKLASKEPIAQFKNWFDEACATPAILEPNAMCLATCTKNGYPSARYVLLKGYGSDGFKFFTNYCSRKGQELSENPNAALVFYWEIFNRSIRIEGTVTKLSEKESTEYFHSRPKASQIGAALSNQSQPVCSRSVLTDRESFISEEYAGCEFIPKPEEWGGFILKPHTIEFWQGQSDRIHDRIRFRIPAKDEIIDNVLLHQGENGWAYERLQP